MVKNFIFLIVIVFSAVRCTLPVPSFEPKPILVKEVSNRNITITWNEYSAAYSIYSDILLITDKLNDKIVDTICLCTNIKAIDSFKDSIKISFNGYPKNYSTKIELNKVIKNYKIAIDY